MTRTPKTESALVPRAVCDLCGGSFSTADLLSLASRNVCAGCKPEWVQRVQEGETHSDAEKYRLDHLRVERRLYNVGVVFVATAIPLLLLSLLLLSVSTLYRVTLRAGVTSGVSLALALQLLYTANGLIKIRPAAPKAVAMSLGIGFFFMIPAGGIAAAVFGVVALVMLALVLQRPAKEVFTEEYRQLRAHTQHLNPDRSVFADFMFAICLGLILGIGIVWVLHKWKPLLFQLR